jgi:hypothetical protein
MAVIKQGILGGFSGSIGSVVGSAWKGIAVMKSKPLSVANPKTAGQITNRTAFSLASKIGSLILADWIKPFWDRFASKMSGYNSWVQANVEFMLDGVIADYSLLIMAVGKLTSVATLGIAADASGEEIILTPTYPALNQFSANSDIGVAVYYNETQDTWIATGDLGTRADGALSIVDASLVAGDVIRLWLAFKRADLSYVSNSFYVTTVVVA